MPASDRQPPEDSPLPGDVTEDAPPNNMLPRHSPRWHNVRRMGRLILKVDKENPLRIQLVQVVDGKRFLIEVNTIACLTGDAGEWEDPEAVKLSPL